VEPVEGIERGGMLYVKGPNQMLGYLLHSQPGVVQPAKSPLAGWYETGDIVEVDADGYVRISGRVKRFAKVAGEMVSLEVVENIANLAAPGKAHASTAVASDRRGEVIVLATEDRTLRRDRLVAAAREAGLPELAVARVVLPVDKIPRLGSGKFDYVTLKELAAARLAGETVEPAVT
jgi:acyl-[acyl-carrier-protein]-phospholipid O-acyltransferase/long-chain-fatty-acid--[acyl-carrier-protein] ligase